MFVQTKEIFKLTITFTSNNIFFNVSNKENSTIIIYSAGIAGFNRLKKKNRVVMQSLILKISRQIKKNKIFFLDVYFKNTTKLTKSLLKCLLKTNLYFNTIKDITPINHNGCRPKKKKRR